MGVGAGIGTDYLNKQLAEFKATLDEPAAKLNEEILGWLAGHTSFSRKQKS